MLKLGNLLLVACVALTLSTGAHREQLVQRDEPPVVVVCRDLGMRPDVESTIRVVFAMWRDGTFLVRSDLNDATSRLLVAEAAPGSFSSLIKVVKASGFLDRQPTFLFPPDGSHTLMRIQYDGRDVSHAWVERINPQNDNAEPAFQAFLEMWLQVRAAVFGVRPVRARWLDEMLDDDGRYRGYDPSDPAGTAWLRGG